MSKVPPPLPPRQNNGQSASLPAEPPPTYDSIMYSGSTMAGPWTSQDPRSSSMHSLVPSESDEQNERRKLLLVYIHGFMGNETSFRSFPAHVHKLLTTLLGETHVVHTKIYPRYRSKRKISFARDDFSTWLEPHEDARTDVILLGHSMGGLVCAEVALKPSSPPASRPLQHRILGTINFDVPFLGMHPGVIRSGLASIFQPAEKTHQDEYVESTSLASPGSPLGRADTLWATDSHDPNYNPPMPNDVILPVRKGWESAWHFVSKHSGDLTRATRQLVSSHMEFGGTMANFGELKVRYTRIRALEEQADDVRKSVVGGGGTPPRVRFVNYYTASTGILKKPKPPAPASTDSTTDQSNANLPLASSSRDLTLQTPNEDSTSLTSRQSHLPNIQSSVGQSREGGAESEASALDYEDVHDEDWETAAETMTLQDPMPIEDDEYDEPDEKSAPEAVTSPVSASNPTLSPTSTLAPTIASSSTLTLSAPLPPIPDLPPVPPLLDVSYIQDAETRKLVEKEHTRAVKAYDKAVKDREKAISDRKRLEEKQERKAQKDAEKAQRDALKASQKAEADRAKQLERQKKLTPEQAQKEAEKAERDALKAKQKADAEKAKQQEKQAKLERKQAEKELTHSQKEMMRLEKEHQRMEAEARRMRGEPEPEATLGPQPEAVYEGKDKDSQNFDEPQEPASSTRSAVENEWKSLTNDIERFESGSTQAVNATSPTVADDKPKAPPKDRKFCVLPPKDANGQRDPCWVRVFMENVDEVGAHCGLFFVDERYERLVGDVAERIEGWVNEDIDRRMISQG